MVAEPDDEWTQIQRIQRDRIAMGLFIGIMAIGAAAAAGGGVGILVVGVGEPGSWPWFALFAVGSLVDFSGGALLVRYMRMTPLPTFQRSAVDLDDER